MLSSKAIFFFRDRKWWFDDVEPVYRDALLRLGIGISSDFSQFYLHVEDGPTFSSKNGEIYQMCWFLNNSDYDGRLRVVREILGIPEPYIPLDSFTGGRGYFYNKETGEVFDIELGDALSKFLRGDLEPKWRGFNEFIEWFFGV
ncbi:hypothetical protein BLA6860_03624 [Burkholderia lata]|uniref:hypothetical protein n=1 Tax=Burkholderia lata (strain ATCC 17760 / DSM 23089 / LMG 22485 / NCIMB 9086 / R18194 / 383) TaxID=482957 RepID=UPI00145448D4|nr:hypothetical protein [Burkholderia lata]VWB76919.1 hypothetical protein BLA6860_03624 [Burkholderia lata]